MKKLKTKECRFDIDFIEFSFLVEACIPPRPIARTMFWYDVIDKYYHILTQEERKILYEWIQKSYSFEARIEKQDEDCLLFLARYNPDNQYRVTTDFNDEIKETDCFLLNGQYYLARNRSILPKYITKIEKL